MLPVIMESFCLLHSCQYVNVVALSLDRDRGLLRFGQNGMPRGKLENWEMRSDTCVDGAVACWADPVVSLYKLRLVLSGNENATHWVWVCLLLLKCLAHSVAQIHSFIIGSHIHVCVCVIEHKSNLAQIYSIYRMIVFFYFFIFLLIREGHLVYLTLFTYFQ